MRLTLTLKEVITTQEEVSSSVNRDEAVRALAEQFRKKKQEDGRANPLDFLKQCPDEQARNELLDLLGYHTEYD